MRRSLLLMCLFIVTCTGIVQAQYDAQFSNYFMAMSYYNPAYAGTSGDLNIFGIHRQQWVGIRRAPKSTFATAEMPITFLGREHGLGAVFFQESAGLFNNMHISVQYAYKKQLFGGVLSVGMQAGMVSQDFDGTEIYIPTDDFYSPANLDGAFPKGKAEGSGFEFNAGVFYTHPKFYFGAGVMHINEPEMELEENVYSYVPRSYNLTAGYNIQTRNPLYELQPSVFLKSDLLTIQADITARVIYNKMFNGGITWRMNESVVLLLGGTFGAFQVGYAYDFPTSAILKRSTGSHELMVKYRLKLKKAKSGKNRHKSVRIL